MYKIVKKEKLVEDIERFYLKAPLIARKVKAGQFVVIRINEDGERIPLTIAGYNRSNGIINIVSMRVGKTTSLLSSLKEGDSILDVVGPLGNASEIENFGRVICVGGGVGVAPIFPIARELKKTGNYVISIIGARSKDLLILKEEMGDTSDELYICSDDGSIGYHGFVSDFLKEYLEKNLTGNADKKKDKRITRIIAIGPALMMASVAEVTKPFNIKTIVSLNSIMVDGTGMCGACRVEVGGKTKFVCVDGPEFDGHQVNFDLLLSRQKTYCDHEKECMDLYKHKCRLPE
ncbi:MAG: sulfide/dihydroorotate dehydrogenase-like FAD/NAD-binding protein [Candidatus Hydromicrobium sp.]|nr:sulfide/dihydroorotate dehydrogenase-like FAD/NAD-binding protein [Candidatus Hydromicrobium sp.]